MNAQLFDFIESLRTQLQIYGSIVDRIATDDDQQVNSTSLKIANQLT